MYLNQYISSLFFVKIDGERRARRNSFDLRRDSAYGDFATFLATMGLAFACRTRSAAPQRFILMFDNGYTVFFCIADLIFFAEGLQVIKREIFNIVA